MELLVYCWNGYQFLLTYVSPYLAVIKYIKNYPQPLKLKLQFRKVANS